MQEEIRATLKQLFVDKDFLQGLQEALAPALEAVVSRALELRDAKIAALEQELSAAKATLASSQEMLKASERQLAAVEVEIDQIETENRKNCLVISGVPELPDENTDRLVVEVAQAAGVTLSATDLDRSHRFGKQRGTIDQPRGILVKLLSHNKRQQLFGARKELSAHRVRDHPVLTAQVLESVFLADFLTRKKQSLLYICRQLKSRKVVWAAYSTNGRIKVRMGEDQPAKTVKDITDLHALLGHDHPDLRELAAASSSTAARSQGETTAPAAPAGAEGSSVPRPDTLRSGAAPENGTVANKDRRQSPRTATQTR